MGRVKKGIQFNTEKSFFLGYGLKKGFVEGLAVGDVGGRKGDDGSGEQRP